MSGGAVDCFGGSIEPFEEAKKSGNWEEKGFISWSDKIVNNTGRIHNPRFVINHYSLKSMDEIEYKLLDRGYAEGERVCDDAIIYRTHKLLKQLFATTKHINQNHKGNFNNFILGSSNKLAFEASKKVSQELAHYNPLLAHYNSLLIHYNSLLAHYNKVLNN